MSEKLFVCKYNLRPRVSGEAVLIPSGKPFAKDVVDADTFKAMLEAGSIYEYEESTAEIVVDDFVIDAPEQEEEPQKATSNKKTASKKKTPAENKPQGLFNLNVDHLADKDLEELDAIHVAICADNDLPTPSPFKSIEEAIDKLTGEA